jgi:hypothetical protein
VTGDWVTQRPAGCKWAIPSTQGAIMAHTHQASSPLHGWVVTYFDCKAKVAEAELPVYRLASPPVGANVAVKEYFPFF